MPGHVQIHILLFLLLCLGGWAYALLRGGAPERIAALILMAGCALTIFVASPFGHRFHSVELGIACVDTTILGGLAWLASKALREWPNWLTAMQAVAVLSHVPILLGPFVMPEAYTILQGLWSWPMMGVLIGGTWAHRTRLRRNGIDPSWKGSSNP